MADLKDPVSPQDNFSASLTAATSLVTGVGAAVGTVTGIVNRAARDHPQALEIGFGLVMGAILISVLPLAGIWPDFAKSTVRKWLLLATTSAYVVGVAICLGTLVYTVTHPPQQLTLNGSVTLSASGETLNVNVKGGGFTSSDRVHVLVEAKGEGRGTWTYVATNGVDPTGAVDYPISLTLPHGTYRQVDVKAWVESAGDAPKDCLKVGSQQSCASFDVVPLSSHPQLVASWSGSGASLAVIVSVSASEVASDQAVAVVISATPVQKPRDPILYSTVLRPDFDGLVKGSITVPIGTGYSSVCVLGRVDAENVSWPPVDTTCPPPPSSDEAWAHLTTP